MLRNTDYHLLPDPVSCPLDWSWFPSPSLTLGLQQPSFETNPIQFAALQYTPFLELQQPSLPFSRTELRRAHRNQQRCWHPDKAATNHLDPHFAHVISRRIEAAFEWLDIRIACMTGDDIEDRTGRVISDTLTRLNQCKHLYSTTNAAIARLVSGETGQPYDAAYAAMSTGISLEVDNAVTNWWTWPLPVLPGRSRMCYPMDPGAAFRQFLASLPAAVIRGMAHIARVLEQTTALQRIYHAWATEANYHIARYWNRIRVGKPSSRARDTASSARSKFDHSPQAQESTLAEARARLQAWKDFKKAERDRLEAELQASKTAADAAEAEGAQEAVLSYMREQVDFWQAMLEDFNHYGQA